MQVGLRRFALGDRAGLVQGHGPQLVPFLKVDAALDQDAFARGSGQSADDGNRRGDHQGAGAGNHQQHQGLVDPVGPRSAEKDRRHDRHQQGHGEHDRRVDPCKLIDEALGGGAAALRRFDRVNDPRQRRVVGLGRHPVLERAGLVDRACEHAVALGFVHRHALAGDRRLIHRGSSAGDHAVERDPLTGPHADHGVQRDRLRRHGAPAAVALAHGRRFRCQLHQAADGVARPIQRLRLDHLGQRKEDHHHRRFRPVPDEHRAGHGDGHQRIDVQIAVLEGNPAFLVGR